MYNIPLLIKIKAVKSYEQVVVLNEVGERLIELGYVHTRTDIYGRITSYDCGDADIKFKLSDIVVIYWATTMSSMNWRDTRQLYKHIKIRAYEKVEA